MGAAWNGKRRYKCSRSDSTVSSTGRRCIPESFKAELVEEAVWIAVSGALMNPKVLKQECERRLVEATSRDELKFERKQVVLALKRVGHQEDRITDAYKNDAMDLGRYKAEMGTLGRRRRELEQMARDICEREKRNDESRGALNRLEQFCGQVSQGLNGLGFEDRQHLLQLLVERVTIEDGVVRVDAMIPTGETAQLRTRHPEHVEGCAKWRK